MTTKVLVFESDATFSQTLTKGLSAYGCELTVVDDGEEGISRASSETPDLILLTIELPRMNGFSVCNKLKRNKDLKSVPLVLLSSEATDETFEQHKRLRTRADAYVHKPVTVEELVLELEKLVSLEKREPTGEEEQELEEVSVDDEMEIEELPESQSSVDAETDEAFGNLMAPAAVESAPESLPAVELESDDVDVDVDVSELEVVVAGPPSEELTAVYVVPPPGSEPEIQSIPPSVDPALMQENAALSAELAEQKKVFSQLEEELAGARAATAAEEDAKAQALSKKEAELAIFEREIDELKAKMESSEGAGTAREFLDLREQLNKKDKEILDIRDGLTSREKELIRCKDDNIAFGREKADLLDKVESLESSQAQLQKERDALADDKALIKKQAEDFKAKSERLSEELDTRSSELKDAREQHENVMATRDAQDATLREDHRKSQDEAAVQAEVAKKEAMEVATFEAQERAAEAQEAALVVAAEDAKKSQEEAVVAREAELKAEHDSKLAALHRANEESLRKLRVEHEQASEEAEQAAAERLSVREGELAREKQAELEVQKNELDAELVALEAKRAALNEELSQRTTERDVLTATLEEREGTVVSLEANVASRRAEVVELSDKFEAESALLSQARKKWEDDSVALGSAKEALGSALEQVEGALGRAMP